MGMHNPTHRRQAVGALKRLQNNRQTFFMNRTTKIFIGAAIVLVATLITIVSIKSARFRSANDELKTGLSLVGLKVTADIQPDSTVLAQCVVDETNNTSRTISVDNINDVNSADIRRVLDDSGNRLKISKRPQGGIFVTLNNPVPPGGAVSYTVELRMADVFKKSAGGEYELKMSVDAGNVTEAHVVHVWRLPPGATLLEKNEAMQAITNAGQIELTIDRIVPPNGTFPVEFRYRPAVAAN
jgi:hypothetical protein